MVPGNTIVFVPGTLYPSLSTYVKARVHIGLQTDNTTYMYMYLQFLHVGMQWVE